MYSQSPLLRNSACRPCVPRWETCPGTRLPYGDGSYRCAVCAPPAGPCRLLPVWGGGPGGGGCPGHPGELRASWEFPSNRSPRPVHRALPWPPPSPLSHASVAARAAAIHRLPERNVHILNCKNQNMLNYSKLQYI